jgi:TFIIF-interacting CTD phosphatase-like protein
MFIKDLRTVVNQWCRHYDNDGDDDVLQRVIMIDNSLLNIQSHPANGLLVDDWTASDPNDQTLLRLLPILDSLRYVRDVRQVLGDSRFGAIC